MSLRFRETRRVVPFRTYAAARTPSHFHSAAKACSSRVGSGAASAIIGLTTIGKGSLRAPGPGWPVPLATAVSVTLSSDGYRLNVVVEQVRGPCTTRLRI